MNEAIEFMATLLVQDHSEYGEPTRYLIQVDTDQGRLFVDISELMGMAVNGNIPPEGEYYIDSEPEAPHG